jgi:uncharacterized membrane protein
LEVKELIYLIGTLIVIAILLFVVSFFLEDNVKQLEEQLEQFSITTMQDMYQLKKKINILEEELLTEVVNIEPARTSPKMPETVKNKPLLIQKVYHLHQQGYSTADISRQTNLEQTDIQTILNHNAG